MNKEEFKQHMASVNNRINEVHKEWCKLKFDYQLLETFLEKKKTDSNYYYVNSQEMFNRQKN